MQLLVNAAIAGSFAALMAAGLSLVYGVLGVFNMALGQLALVGGYVAWWSIAQAGFPLPIAVGFSVLVTAIVTWLSFEIFIQPFYKRHRFLPLVTTIAMSMILDGIILIMFHEDPKSIALSMRQSHQLGSALISTEQVTLILLTVFFLLALSWMLVRTSLGRKVRATVQHSSAAESLGINSFLLHRLVFIMSGVLACFGGIFQAIDKNLTPTLGFAITIKAYAALIAGGKGSLSGTVFFAYVIALLEQLAIGIPWFGFYIPAGYQHSVALFVIVIILLLKPEGVFGSRIRMA